MKDEFDLILEYVCAKRGVSPDDVKSKSRKPEFVIARSIVIFWFKSIYSSAISWKEIGRWMNIDHSSVISAYKNMEKDIYKVRDLMPEMGKPLDHQHFTFMNMTYDVKPRYRVVK